MDVTAIINVISTVGFPIVACVFMWRFVTNTLTKFTATMSEMTTVLTKLCDKIDLQIDEVKKSGNNTEFSDQ
jgi:hypothetical protein